MNIKDRLAQAISFVFNPLFWVIGFLAAAYHKGLFQDNSQIMAVFVVILIILSITYFMLLKTKKIADPDISRRQERYLILTVINVCSLILLVFLKTHELTELFRLVFIAYIILTVSSLITLVYKISFHMTFTYSFILLIDSLYQFKLFYLYILIPVVFWSRLALKKHTVFELLLALAIDSSIIYNMI